MSREPDNNPIAVVDIGSNSVRLVVYESASRAPAVLFNEKILCGLGRSIASTGRMAADAVARALVCAPTVSRADRSDGREAGPSYRDRCSARSREWTGVHRAG
jgi:hypothetical protein